MKVFLYLLCSFCFAVLQAQPNYNGGSYDGFATGNKAANAFNLFTGGTNDGFHCGNLPATVFNIYAGGGKDGFSQAGLSQATAFNIYAGGYNDGVSHAGITKASAFNIYSGGSNDGVSQAAISNATVFNIYKGGSNDGFHSAVVAPLRVFNMYNGGMNDGFSASILNHATPFNLFTGGINDGFAYLNMPTCSPASNITAYFTNITATTVKFNWITANEGAQFLVKVYAAGITAPVHTFTGATVADTNSVMFTGLTPAYNYCITVEEQCDAYRSSGVSSQFCFTTATASTCAMPSNQGIWFTSGQYLMVKWQSVLYGYSSKAYEIAGGLNITSPNQATTREINGYYISQTPAYPSFPFFTGNVPGFTWYVRDICNPGDTSAWLGPYIVGSSKTDGTETTAIIEAAEQNTASSLIVYPNPNRDGRLYIKATELGDNTPLFIYSVEGQLALQTSIVNSMVDVSALSNGVYLLRIETPAYNSKLKKLVIQQ